MGCQIVYGLKDIANWSVENVVVIFAAPYVKSPFIITNTLRFSLVRLVSFNNINNMKIWSRAPRKRTKKRYVVKDNSYTAWKKENRDRTCNWDMCYEHVVNIFRTQLNHQLYILEYSRAYIFIYFRPKFSYFSWKASDWRSSPVFKNS